MGYVEDLEERVLFLEMKLEEQTFKRGTLNDFSRLVDEQLKLSEMEKIVASENTLDYYLAETKVNLMNIFKQLIIEIRYDIKRKKKKQLEKKKVKYITID